MDDTGEVRVCLSAWGADADDTRIRCDSLVSDVYVVATRKIVSCMVAHCDVIRARREVDERIEA